VARDYGCTLADDIYAGIGYGKFAARQVLAKLAPSAKLEPVQVSRLASSVKRALGVASDGPFRWTATMTSWSIAPNVAAPFAAKNPRLYYSRQGYRRACQALRQRPKLDVRREPPH